MRNEFIGTSIDNDARAACGCNGSANTINTAGNGCGGCNACIHQARCCKEHAPQSRQGGCACNECDECRSRQHSKGCGDCENSCARQHRPDSCGCNGRTTGMVYAEHHDLDSMYGPQKALLRGTLFGCLDKPMCGERCADNACTTCCQEGQFAAWELRLYLNTHPCDQKALAMYNKLIQQMDDNCACSSQSDCSRWTWADGPWPWEYQRCCNKED